MKKILFSVVTAFMLVSVFSSCSNDNEEIGIKFEEKTYSTWSKVVFGYGSMYDANETLTVNQNQVSFHSDTWGDGAFAVSEFKQNADGSYNVIGIGTISMEGHGGKKDYEATVTGTITKDAQTFTISIPSVMGGTVLNVTAGQIPTAAAVEGSYTGGTYADCRYFQHYQPTKDEKVSIKANESLTAVSLSYTSGTWGEFTFEDMTVTKAEDGSYTLTGEGKTLMPSMQGGSKEYVANFEGTITGKTLVATFTVPAVMGGTTVYFNAADFNEVFEAANANVQDTKSEE